MGGKTKFVSDCQEEVATSVKTEGLQVSQVDFIANSLYSEYNNNVTD
jgi:hypothetical protein